MIPKTITSVLVLFIALGLFAQDDRSFSDFLKLFPGKTISPEDQMKFLGIKGPFPEERLEFEKRTAKSVVRSNKDFTMVSVQYECIAGGICESIHLYSFTNSGKLISLIETHNQLADCAFQKSTETLLFNDTIIVTKDYAWEGECIDEPSGNESIRINTYLIEETGNFNLIREQVVDISRLYYKTSTQVLSREELHLLSKEELATMRNEIFACYGYRFKTQKWFDYFQKYEWYEATHDEINETDLTAVELLNLQLIKELELE
ncbi:YARHG domain-containing protein [Marinoscillum pacificum]|uniref:YARHG domain-containing protein n=1 Tax=Marinoscillum pacificum TaxID=392723 RepID=UPI0021573CDB|nr:YARHG domain-containing protein [Marinoscillum pacificum]